MAKRRMLITYAVEKLHEIKFHAEWVENLSYSEILSWLKELNNELSSTGTNLTLNQFFYSWIIKSWRENDEHFAISGDSKPTTVCSSLDKAAAISSAKEIASQSA